MNIDKIKECLKTIVELVEDDKFPARRNITDYVLQLVPNEFYAECDKYVNSLYSKIDEGKI